MIVAEELQADPDAPEELAEGGSPSRAYRPRRRSPPPSSCSPVAVRAAGSAASRWTWMATSAALQRPLRLDGVPRCRGARPPAPEGRRAAGRIARSSNATFLTEVTLDEDSGPRGVQAVYKPPRRTPAGRLPRRHLPPGDRGVRARRGARLGPRARDRADRRSARPGLAAGFVEVDDDDHHFTMHDEDDPHPPGSYDASAASTCSPTTPTARAGTACSTGTATCGRSTTPCRSMPSSSCAR